VELVANSKIYIDTNLFIYYFENNPKYTSKVESIFEESIDKNIQLISSELLYLELLVLPNKERNNKILNLYKNIEDYMPSLKLINISKEILIGASEIRARYNYRSPDSIHLATAKVEKCKYFYGADKNLKSFKDVEIVII